MVRAGHATSPAARGVGARRSGATRSAAGRASDLNGQRRPVGPLEARFHAAVLEREPDREVLFLADEIRRLAQLAGVRRFAYPNRLVGTRDYPRRNFDEAAPRRLCDQRV